MSGKGSAPRPFSVGHDTFAKQFEAIFGKKNENRTSTECPWPKPIPKPEPRKRGRKTNAERMTTKLNLDGDLDYFAKTREQIKAIKDSKKPRARDVTTGRFKGDNRLSG